jgi:hypothetical protein
MKYTGMLSIPGEAAPSVGFVNSFATRKEDEGCPRRLKLFVQ